MATHPPVSLASARAEIPCFAILSTKSALPFERYRRAIAEVTTTFRLRQPGRGNRP